MIVLGFDTATPATAVGLRLADGTTFTAYEDAPSAGPPGHVTRLLALSEELLERAGIGWGAVERIAVGVGPGTFTGLRIGVASARSLGQSLEVPAVGVSSLRVLGEAAARSEHGGILAAIDARRGEVFLAARLPDGELGDVQVIASERLQERFEWPRTQDGTPWVAVGDGAIRYRAELRELGVAVPEDTSALHRVDGGVLCELAQAGPVSELEGILPDYQRRPDAEIALEARVRAEQEKAGTADRRESAR